MSLYRHAMAGLGLATALLAAQAMAADTSTNKKDTGVHVETRTGAAETPADVKGEGTGILGTGPVKVRPEDQKAGKAEKMYDSQYETDRTKKKGN
ncbi:hypothetical protein [Pseudomonas sp. RIT-PI-S]|uniref:hypothetical protein n=1 Tax=Pseudomonas sp. RIT-PI-S TaxID=3035295 RepID=UPI0021D7F449|nr:hypothetical protein [Pseudomonas sp. RIT-PI-S]